MLLKTTIMISNDSSVIGELNYLTSPEERVFTYMYNPPEGNAQGNCVYTSKNTTIRDARRLSQSISLNQQGFQLYAAPSRVTDFYDEEEIKRVYYPETAHWLSQITGASDTLVFDHMIRKREAGRTPMTFGRHDVGSNTGVAGRVHNDYSEQSGRSKLAMVVNDPARLASIDRYCIINIWRPVNHPVMDTPLALCDAQTVSTLDLVCCEVRRPDRQGEIYLVRYSPRHRWYFYPDMAPAEILLIKQFDSQLNGIARMTPHSAFDLPEIPEGSPLRESIEMRCLVIY